MNTTLNMFYLSARHVRSSVTKLEARDAEIEYVNVRAYTGTYFTYPRALQ